MKRAIAFAFASSLAIPVLVAAADGPTIPTLAIGAQAPDFDLPGVDGKRYTLASFDKAKVLVLVFTANHCPTAQAYEDRIAKLEADYASRGVQLVLVSVQQHHVFQSVSLQVGFRINHRRWRR